MMLVKASFWWLNPLKSHILPDKNHGETSLDQAAAGPSAPPAPPGRQGVRNAPRRGWLRLTCHWLRRLEHGDESQLTS